MAISQNFPEEGPTLNLNFAGSKVLDPRITFSRSSVGTYMDENGLVATASTDSPRFDHRYVNGEVESLGLLVEEQRENLLNYSEDFSASPGGWSLSATGASRTQNLIGPDGVANSAWTITDSDNSNDLPQFYKQISISASSSTKYCISCFMKDVDNAGITPDLYVFFLGNSTRGSYVRYTFSTDSFTAHAADGGGIQPSIYGSIPYPNGWVRLYFVVDDSNNGSNTALQFRIYPNSRWSNKTGSMGFFGAQVEVGSFPTSYIPTSGSTKTRNHDRAYYENVDQTDWFSKTEGTIVFEHTDVPYHSSTSTGWPAVGFGETAGGGSNPSIQYLITKDYGAGTYLARRFYPNGDSANINVSGAGSAAPASKVGFVYKEDDYVLVRNGSVVGTDSSGAVPSAYMLILGMNAISNTGNNWNAHLKNLQYYPTRLSNTVLQNLTK